MPGLSDVWGLEYALFNKANRQHLHTFSDVAGLLEALQAIQQEGSESSQIFISSVEGLAEVLDEKAALVHGHTTSQIADLDAILISLQDAINQRAVTSHSHSLATSSAAGFMSASDKIKLEGLGGSTQPLISDVQGLQSALDAKSETSHTHAGLPGATLSALAYTFSQSSVMASANGSYTNLTDGNSATGAGTDATGSFSWLKADLGSTKILNRVKLWGGSIPGWGDTSVYLKGATLECSTDDSNWIILIPVLTGVVNANAVTFAIPQIQARYVRISRPSYVGATEFLIYGQ